jgi:hypothetical protein
LLPQNSSPAGLNTLAHWDWLNGKMKTGMIRTIQMDDAADGRKKQLGHVCHRCLLA